MRRLPPLYVITRGQQRIHDDVNMERAIDYFMKRVPWVDRDGVRHYLTGRICADPSFSASMDRQMYCITKETR